MSVIDDAQAAYNAWKESAQGSYLERVLADAIVRDIVPGLIHAASRRTVPIGYASEITLESDTALAGD